MTKYLLKAFKIIEIPLEPKKMIEMTMKPKNDRNDPDG